MNFLYKIPVVGVLFKVMTVKSNLKTMKSLFHATPEEMRAYQTKKLKELIHHAYNNVGLYRKKWDAAGVHPDDIKTLEDIEKLPIVSKDDFRNAWPHDMIAKGWKEEDCHLFGTSGSTGSPVKVLYDKEKTLFEIATMTRPCIEKHMRLANLGEGLYILVTDEDAMEVLTAKEFKKAEEYIVNALDPVEKHIEEINRRKPDYIISYPSVLRNIAIKVHEENIQIHQPKVLLTSGESLFKPTVEVIKRAFNCEVFDAYGATEVGIAAFECCFHEGMHTVPHKVIIEIADDSGQLVKRGDCGNIIVTDLINKATPVIRYSGMGDISEFSTEECSCGLSKTFPMLRRIEGRKIDSIVLPDKRIVHPFKLTLAMQDTPTINKFQIRQESMNDFRVLVVREHSHNDAKNRTFAPGCPDYEKINLRFKEILGDHVNVKMEVVEDIPRKEGSHKYATVVSLVSKD